jgi:hypothetical protein
VKGLIRAIAFFVISIVVGEIVRRLLMSGVGRGAVERLGRPDLGTHEGASAASKEAKRAIGFVRSLTSGNPPAVVPTRSRQSGWVGIAADAAEMLLTAGALLKTASDFAHEDAKLRRRIAGPAEGS